MSAKERTLKLPDGSTVSALWQKPKNAKAVLVKPLDIAYLYRRLG